MTEKFFVYGSYCAGYCQAKKLDSWKLSSEPAQVLGTAYKDSFGYPVVFSDGTDNIEGELIDVNMDATQMAYLDEMMGFNPLYPDQSLFFRQESNIKTADTFVKAWVYFANPAQWNLSGAQKIESGLWKQNLQQQVALPETLSEKQKSYILKLGNCTGRDVVRIDLALYRELMNLELILDKGRRLALTKKGQEVYRYIKA